MKTPEIFQPATSVTASCEESRLSATVLPYELSLAVVPKFIQSSYYEVFLTELFPYEAEPSSSNGPPSKSKVGFRHDRERVPSESLEAVRNDPEAAAKTIAAAVAVAVKAARSGEKNGRGSVTEEKVKRSAHAIHLGRIDMCLERAKIITTSFAYS